MTRDETLALGRAVSFSILAPLQLFYGLWTGQFPIPFLFICLLLSGYTFAILSSFYAHNITIFSIYATAFFFVFALLITKTIYQYG